MESIWKEVISLCAEYERLGIAQVIDQEKFYIYSIIAHSTAIEGSTITEEEVQRLFDLGISANKKPMLYHHMNTDLKMAYDFAKEAATRTEKVTPDFLKKLNGIVMKNTGSTYNSMQGTWNAAEGDFRLHGVRAGIDGKSYVNYMKVPVLVQDLCVRIDERFAKASSLEEIYDLSFDAHLELVTIHPWADGNGRTSRLLMNYLQFLKNVPPTKMFSQDKSDYIDALIKAQDKGDVHAFKKFMAEQQIKTLKEEISHYSE